MARYVDFPTIYGKLGNHFGLTTGDQALALFEQGMRCPPGATLVEYAPDGGRSTVILATVARNLGGRLLVCTAWPEAPQGALDAFQRAFKTHRLAAVVSLDPPEVPGDVAFQVVRGAFRPPQASRLFVLGDVGLSNGHAPVEHGPGWAVLDYRPAVVLEPEVLQMPPPVILAPTPAELVLAPENINKIE
jgi:hypothetical protein